MLTNENTLKTHPTAKDPLSEFLRYWLKARDFSPPMEQDTPVTYFHGKVIGSVLYRRGSFQVQLFTVAPNVEIPDHIHPNMDSYEVHVGGDIAFRVNGTYNLTQNPEFPGCVRIHPDDYHGGSFGKRGGLFLSVQHWLNGIKPSSAGEDWAFKDAHETETNYADEKASDRFYKYLDDVLVNHFASTK